MKKQTKKEINRLLSIAKGTPKRNDLNTGVVKDLEYAKKSGRELTGKIAIINYKSWKRS